MKGLVIVDMLNDFVQGENYHRKQNPGQDPAVLRRHAPLYDGLLVVPGAADIIDNIGLLRRFSRRNGITIYANDSHDEDDIEFKNWPKHAVKGTYGARVIDELESSEGDLVIEKKDLSLFTNPDTHRRLQEQEIDELYFAGVATEYCVRGGALDAAKLGYKVNLVVDAIAGVDLKQGDQYRALLEMGKVGVRAVTTEQALEEIVK